MINIKAMSLVSLPDSPNIARQIIPFFVPLHCSNSTGTLVTAIEDKEVRAAWISVVEAEERIKNDVFQRSH